MASGGTPALRASQVREAERRGFACAVFGYHVLFDSRNTVLAAQDDAASREREALRAAILPALGR
jgi:hypothetical protein